MGFKSSRCKFSIREISFISLAEYCLITTGIVCLPAILHARKRRSPAIIIYEPSPLSFTTIGIMTPCFLIESASSLKACSSKFFLGWLGLAVILSRGISSAFFRSSSV